MAIEQGLARMTRSVWLNKWTTGEPFHFYIGVRNTQLRSGHVGFGMPEII